MGAVGGSRHYAGGGLGQERGWACPSCGGDNAGPIAQGCSLCGAGRPGRHIGVAPPAPPTATPEPQPEPEPAPAPEGEHGEFSPETWARQHPEVTVADAYRAGYYAGVRATLEAQQRQATAPEYNAEYVVNRTIIAALALFRDQVLVGTPEEVTTGEWLSAEQVTQLMREIDPQGETHG